MLFGINSLQWRRTSFRERCFPCTLQLNQTCLLVSFCNRCEAMWPPIEFKVAQRQGGDWVTWQMQISKSETEICFSLTSCSCELGHCALGRPNHDIDVVLFEDLINSTLSCNIMPMRYEFVHLLGSKIACLCAFEQILAWITWKFVSSSTRKKFEIFTSHTSW